MNYRELSEKLLSLLGGHQDFDDDILRGKQGIYFLMLNLLTATLMVLVRGFPYAS